MTLQQLRDYNNWVGKSAQEILDTVRKEGGWVMVFPDRLPVWAHRVRNFFNREPRSLLRLEDAHAKPYLRRIEAKRPHESWFSLRAKIGGKFALSDDVYKDWQGWVWYQMNEGGTIYHWGRDPILPGIEAPKQEIKEKIGIPVPVFKLVAPDQTGGSRETVLRNIHGWFVAVKRNNYWADVTHMTIRDPLHRGSYNYSETVSAGLSAHTMRDIDPHEKYPFPDVYVNPPNPFSLLSQRIFPEKVKDEPNPLAKQV